MEIVAIDLDREYFAKYGNFFPITGKSSISEVTFVFVFVKRLVGEREARFTKLFQGLRLGL